MKIAVLGASRGTGLLIIEQGLERRHTMTALVRNRRAFQPAERLRIVEGDVRDREALDAAVTGQDAVCWSVGIGPTQKRVTLFSDATRILIDSMERAGVRRLLCITGVGTGESKGHGGVLYDKVFKPLFLRTMYQDKDRQEELIRASRLDWTIVRPGFLTHGPRTGNYRVITDLTGQQARMISRADVADFMLNSIESGEYIRTAVLLTT